jgi:hypothetical protein
MFIQIRGSVLACEYDPPKGSTITDTNLVWSSPIISIQAIKLLVYAKRRTCAAYIIVSREISLSGQETSTREMIVIDRSLLLLASRAR